MKLPLEKRSKFPIGKGLFNIFDGARKRRLPKQSRTSFFIQTFISMMWNCSCKFVDDWICSVWQFLVENAKFCQKLNGCYSWLVLYICYQGPWGCEMSAVCGATMQFSKWYSPLINGKTITLKWLEWNHNSYICTQHLYVFYDYAEYIKIPV